MEFKRLSDEQLLVSLEREFALERKASHNILLHLKEVQARRLYAERGFPNLFTMLIQFFHQSESAANQRLKALELMSEVPVVEEGLVSGKLTLSTVAMAQRQIRREEKLSGQKVSSAKKAEIVESITGKTIAQAEAELFRQLPETAAHPKTVEQRVSADATRLHLTLPDDVLQMLNKLKEVWAHVDASMDTVEVIRRAFKIAIVRSDPAIKGKTRRATESAKHRATRPASSRRLTYYGREFDRVLWERAGSQCEYVDEKAERRCDCRHGLQREHVIPLALGGTNELENMQLLCRTHNLLRARKVFGAAKIDAHMLRRRFGRGP